MTRRLTASQRQQALKVSIAANALCGVPAVQSFTDHGITILADPITAARWETWARTAQACCGVVTVTAVDELAVTA